MLLTLIAQQIATPSCQQHTKYYAMLVQQYEQKKSIERQ